MGQAIAAQSLDNAVAPTWQNSIPKDAHTLWYSRSMERLVGVVQELSRTQDLEGVMQVVRTAARALTGADGATFVLRDGQKCHYADEDAISPLWKGQRFPMTSCISGWVMLNALPAVIEDIYNDMRIPAEAYRPTFVKSLVMVPIRQTDPIGAIGTYWVRNRLPRRRSCPFFRRWRTSPRWLLKTQTCTPR